MEHPGVLGIFLMPFQCTRAQRPRSAVCNGSCNAHMQLPKFRQLNAMEALTSTRGGGKGIFRALFLGLAVNMLSSYCHWKTTSVLAWGAGRVKTLHLAFSLFTGVVGGINDTTPGGTTGSISMGKKNHCSPHLLSLPSHHPRPHGAGGV